VAAWYSEGQKGRGPLTVPAPIAIQTAAGRTEGRPPQASSQRPAAQHTVVVSDSYDPYAGDPIGRELGLPPRMDTSVPGTFFGTR
jgi:hypothetical protein